MNLGFKWSVVGFLGGCVLAALGQVFGIGLPQGQPRIHAIVDSIGRPIIPGNDVGEGWVKFMSGDVSVIPENARTSRYTLAHLDDWIAPADVTVFGLGLWDLRKGIPLDEYRANLFAIGRKLQLTGAKVYFLTITPVSPDGILWHEADVRRYNTVAAEVMEELGVEVIDLHGFTWPYRDRLLDEVHYDPSVSRAQADFIASHL